MLGNAIDGACLLNFERSLFKSRTLCTPGVETEKVEITTAVSPTAIPTSRRKRKRLFDETSSLWTTDLSNAHTRVVNKVCNRCRYAGHRQAVD